LKPIACTILAHFACSVARNAAYSSGVEGEATPLTLAYCSTTAGERSTATAAAWMRLSTSARRPLATLVPAALAGVPALVDLSRYELICQEPAGDADLREDLFALDLFFAARAAAAPGDAIGVAAFLAGPRYWRVAADLGLIALTCLLANLGIAVLGSLYACLALFARARELLLPVLFLPSLLPVVIAAAGAVNAVAGGTNDLSEYRGYSLFLGVYAVIFALVAYATYDHVFDD